MLRLEQGDIITFGVDLKKRENSKNLFRFLSFELKFKSHFIDLTASDNDGDDHGSLKVLIKTTQNGIKTIEKVPNHRNNKRSSSRSSAEPSTSNSSSDDKNDENDKKPKKNEKKADKQVDKKPKNEMNSNGNKDIDNFVERRDSLNDHLPRNETVREPPMVEIPKNSYLNKPKCAIEIDAMPLKIGKRRADENIQSSSKMKAVESTWQSPVSDFPTPIQSPCDTTQNDAQMNQELIMKMINWKYAHMQAGAKYTTKLNMIPPKCFESLEQFKK